MQYPSGDAGRVSSFVDDIEKKWPLVLESIAAEAQGRRYNKNSIRGFLPDFHAWLFFAALPSLHCQYRDHDEVFFCEPLLATTAR